MYAYGSNGNFVLNFIHSNPMDQLNDEAGSAFGQICRQAESGHACWFAADLEDSDPFSLARILLGISYGELSIVQKLAGVTKVDRKGSIERVNREAKRQMPSIELAGTHRPNRIQIAPGSQRSCRVYASFHRGVQKCKKRRVPII